MNKTTNKLNIKDKKMKIDTRNKLQKVLLKTVNVDRNDYLMDEANEWHDKEIKYEIMDIITFCLGWFHEYKVHDVERMIGTLKKINKDMLTKNKELALKEYEEYQEKLNELED